MKKLNLKMYTGNKAMILSYLLQFLFYLIHLYSGNLIPLDVMHVRKIPKHTYCRHLKYVFCRKPDVKTYIKEVLQPGLQNPKSAATKTDTQLSRDPALASTMPILHQCLGAGMLTVGDLV